jgi:hypothetical protein
MAAQRPAARRLLLLRGQRLENSKQIKAFTLDAIRLRILGEYPYKNADDLVAALNEADPQGIDMGTAATGVPQKPRRHAA